MKTNWSQTDYNDRVAINNYYREGKPMAMVYLMTPYSGILGRWWVPIEHRDTFGVKVVKRFRDEIPGSIVSVEFPLPNVESAWGQELFAPYIVKEE
jgi:hypothetical protein